MKHSLKLKLTLILAGLVAILIVGSLLANMFFLEDYYQLSKEKSISQCYKALNETVGQVAEYNLTDELSGRIEGIESNYDLSIYLLSEGYDERGPYVKFLYPNSVYMKDVRTRKFERVRDALFSYIFADIGYGEGDRLIELLTGEEGIYDVYKYYDDTVNSTFMDLLGYLDGGTMVFIRTNFDSIRESADISAKFMTYVGIAILILGAAIMFLFSRTFTKQIKEMSDIAKKMSDLDFERKYEGRRRDEIGELGNSINLLSNHLESTISELKSANNELMRDNEQKTQIDEMRKDFLSNVSHELKTPIALIQGYAEGLKENINDDPESRDFYCDVIMDESMKMNNMVKKLLTLNQIEFGQNSAELEHFDVTALVRAVAEAQEILMKQKGIRLVIDREEPVFVWADQFMIEEVITNYISNAINHIDGERIIRIGFEIKDDIVRISVFNSGQQIPKEDIDKVWIKFFKVDKARTREYGGSGIGLSIVKAIMDSHNREVGLINHEDGVEFWFELDCSKGA